MSFFSRRKTTRRRKENKHSEAFVVARLRLRFSGGWGGRTPIPFKVDFLEQGLIREVNDVDGAITALRTFIPGQYRVSLHVGRGSESVRQAFLLATVNGFLRRYLELPSNAQEPYGTTIYVDIEKAGDCISFLEFVNSHIQWTSGVFLVSPRVTLEFVSRASDV